MNKVVYWVIFAFLVAYAITDDAIGQEAPVVPVEECGRLAEAFAKAPASLSIGELDSLRLCIVDIMVMQMEETNSKIKR